MDSRKDAAKPRKESEVKKAVQDWLKAHGYTFYRMNTGMSMMPGRGGKLMPVRFGTPGMADLLVILPPNGRAVWLEIKRPLGPRGGTGGSDQSPDQVLFADEQSRLGAGYRLIRDLDQLGQAMKEECETARIGFEGLEGGGA